MLRKKLIATFAAVVVVGGALAGAGSALADDYITYQHGRSTVSQGDADNKAIQYCRDAGFAGGTIVDRYTEEEPEPPFALQYVSQAQCG